MKLTDFPDIMLDWDPDRNPDIDPQAVSTGSHRVIHWKCHKCGRQWSSEARTRIAGVGCVCDAQKRKAASFRKRLVDRDGSLAELRPDIAAQWHPTRNGDLSPMDVTCKSTYRAWWIDDSGREWQTQVAIRCKSPTTVAPIIHTYPGYNDLATTRPDLADEWNYERNADLHPSQVTAGSNLRVWWCCKRGHEWQAIISSRNAGRGCPVCNKERNTSFPEQTIFYYLKKIYPSAQNRYIVERNLEIDIFIPEHNIGIEYDGSYYHSHIRKQNTDARKETRLRELGIILIRVKEETSNICQNGQNVIIHRKRSLDAAVADIIAHVANITGVKASLDIDSERDKTEIWEQYVISEKEQSVATKFPELIGEWHPSKNGKLKPENVQYASSKRIWWQCSVCGYEWQTSVSNRAFGTGCPVCTGHIVKKGINDILTTHPELAREWDYEANIGIRPEDFSAGSSKKVWWKCPKCEYRWQAVISNRSRGRNCPRCAGKIADVRSSLLQVYPELAAQWDHEKNPGVTPDQVLPHSEKLIWWRCKKGHSWQATVASRSRGNDCPVCGNRKLLVGYNDLRTTHPILADEWDDDKNDVRPTEVFSGSSKSVWWKCKQGHSWKAPISSRARGTGCPYCSGRLAIKGVTDLATTYPDLIREWHSSKNIPLTPDQVTPGSSRKVWWKCCKCNYEWSAIIWSRVKGRGCPSCAGKVKTETNG